MFNYSEPKKKKKRRRKRIKNNSDSSDGEKSGIKRGRKNIRRVMKAKDLEMETKLATKEEIERKKRIEDRQKMVK